MVTPESARAHLEAGRFREAIAGFKDLHKQGPTEDARLGLAAAYAGRAGQLADKGMLKEALVMWENRAALGRVPWRLEHAVALLRLGRIDQVMPMLDGPDLRDDPQSKALLLSHLAARCLGGDPAIAPALPADHPLRAQAGAAEEALDAYCAGNDTAVVEALKAIPFRSPYRDLVQILRALMRLGPDARDPSGGWTREARDQVARLFDAVSDDSGFAPLRTAAQLALLPDAELALRLPDLGPATRELVFALRGWSAERAALWGELRRLGDQPKPRDLLRLMFRHRRALGEVWTHERGLRLLLPDIDGGNRWWREVTGRDLSDLDLYLLDAWQSETEGEADPWHALVCWKDYANLYQDELGGRLLPGSDESLRIALARRRPVNLFKILEHAPYDTDADSMQGEAAAELEASLTQDPDDQLTYLTLIRYHLRGKALKEARRILALAQERWPTDKTILTAAMDVALASGAFKKAAGLAADILAGDPINSPVRERLVEAHLAHARKNLLDRRPDLAGRALAQAEEWARGEHLRERLELLRGLIGIRAGAAEAEHQLRALVADLGNGLAARLVVLLEARACGEPSAPLLKRLGLTKAPPPDAADLRAFLTRLRTSLDAGTNLSSEISRQLTAPLKRAARLALERDELEAICETLRRTSLHEARRAFAEAALQRWRGEPVFELHLFEARHGSKRPWNIPIADLERLERALDRARVNGDSRLIHRFIDLLGRLAGPLGGPRGPFRGSRDDFIWDDLDDWDDEDDEDELPDIPAPDPMALVKDMIQTIGPDAFWDLLKAPGPIGEVMRELERALGKQQLRAMVEAMAAAGTDEVPAFPRPRSSAPTSRQGQGASKRRQPEGKPGGETLDPDEDPSQQLDLFE